MPSSPFVGCGLTGPVDTGGLLWGGLAVVFGTEVSAEQHTPINLEQKIPGRIHYLSQNETYWSPIGQALAAKVVKESKNLLECSQCSRNRHWTVPEHPWYFQSGCDQMKLILDILQNFNSIEIDYTAECQVVFLIGFKFGRESVGRQLQVCPWPASFQFKAPRNPSCSITQILISALNRQSMF